MQASTTVYTQLVKAQVQLQFRYHPVSTNGDTVLVEVYVADIAPGLSSYDIAARFPSGVPAVSDASMTDWMQYVWMQYPRPTNTTGVPVSITVVDPNNNYYPVGMTTSDENGFYSCSFVPEVPGQYKIISTFEGSKSFYPSHAETAITVGDAPQATTEPASENVSVTDAYFLPAIAAIIVTIVLVGAVIMLLQKKRP
jgi:hypothetical protein